jgi:transcriptional regulator GlxA family with amidase domain
VWPQAWSNERGRVLGSNRRGRAGGHSHVGFFDDAGFAGRWARNPPASSPTSAASCTGASDSVRTGRTTLFVRDAIADVPELDVLVVPGGSNGTWAMTQDSTALRWIQRIDAGSRYTTSVCTGSWVLGAAGLLRGKRATSNWYRAGQMMSRYGATFVPARYVADGKYWTSAGVSAGIDMSLALVAELANEQVARDATRRLSYWPSPPARGGSPEKTDDLVLDMMQQMYDFLMVPLVKQ